MKIVANGIFFNAITAGQGEPVTFLHAIGLDLTWWDQQIAALVPGYQVIAYDQRGHGGSDQPPGGYDLATLAQDLAALLDALALTRTHLVGLSLGGMVAQQFALLYPERVYSLVLIDTACTFSPEARAIIARRAETAEKKGMEGIREATIQRWFTPSFQRDRPDVIDRCEKTLLAQNASAHAALWHTIAQLDLADHIGKIRCPTLVLVGEQDGSTPPDAARMVAERIPGATFSLVPGAGHLAPVEAPERINAALKQFLAGGL